MASARLSQEWLTCVDGHCCLQHSLDTDTLGQALLHTPAEKHIGRREPRGCDTSTQSQQGGVSVLPQQAHKETGHNNLQPSRPMCANRAQHSAA